MPFSCNFSRVRHTITQNIMLQAFSKKNYSHYLPYRAIPSLSSHTHGTNGYEAYSTGTREIGAVWHGYSLMEADTRATGNTDAEPHLGTTVGPYGSASSPSAHLTPKAFPRMRLWGQNSPFSSTWLLISNLLNMAHEDRGQVPTCCVDVEDRARAGSRVPRQALSGLCSSARLPFAYINP